MSVNPRVRDVVRQSWPKRHPRTPKPNPHGFPKPVKAIMFGRSGERCEIDDCGPASTCHHRGPRSAGGTREGWVNQAANGLVVADACHNRIESNRTAAYVNGWLVSRLGSKQAADVPVLYRGRWVLLADDGSVRPIGVGA
jgi:hypothetical protein